MLQIFIYPPTWTHRLSLLQYYRMSWISSSSEGVFVGRVDIYINCQGPCMLAIEFYVEVVLVVAAWEHGWYWICLDGAVPEVHYLMNTNLHTKSFLICSSYFVGTFVNQSGRRIPHNLRNSQRDPVHRLSVVCQLIAQSTNIELRSRQNLAVDRSVLVEELYY